MAVFARFISAVERDDVPNSGNTFPRRLIFGTTREVETWI